MEITFAIIFSLFINLFSLTIFISMIKDHCEVDGKSILGFVIIFTTIVSILLLIYVEKPRAIHVYQGLTTLEITYKDGTPIDSVVVWKNK